MRGLYDCIKEEKSKADEMFKNIKGYKIAYHYENDEIIEYKLVQNYYYEDYIYHLKGEYLDIIFDKAHHILNVAQEDCENYKTITAVININIYKAINEKCKELGWL